MKCDKCNAEMKELENVFHGELECLYTFYHCVECGTACVRESHYPTIIDWSYVKEK
jgi:hypothetical protein